MHAGMHKLCTELETWTFASENHAVQTEACKNKFHEERPNVSMGSAGE
jgi:hypothetical protein